MGRVISISEEAYRALSALARERGSSVETLIEAWAAQQAKAEAERDPYTDPRYYTTEEWFRHLGADDDLIREAHELAQKDDGDADA